MKTIEKLQGTHGWPEAVRFLPYVGNRYLEGFDGIRVLVLGESHYVSDGVAFDGVEERGFTRHMCSDLATAEQRDRRQFFRHLDMVVAQNVYPTPAQARAGWARVAFANFVQVLVGEKGHKRPRPEQWETGREAWPYLIGHLKPHAVLVVGRQNFDNMPDEPANFLHDLKPDGVRRERSLYDLSYPGGSVLMSWIYHTARTNERPDERVAVFDALLKEAGERRTRG